MAVRSTQQVRMIIYDTDATVRLTSIKAELLRKEASVAGGSGVVVVIFS